MNILFAALVKKLSCQLRPGKIIDKNVDIFHLGMYINSMYLVWNVLYDLRIS
jgi:hypothetical protein